MALVQQTILLIIAGLMLDGGRLLRAISGALIVSWLLSLCVMLWYHEHPTPFSIAVVKYGFWLALVGMLLFGRLMGCPAVVGV